MTFRVVWMCIICCAKNCADFLDPFLNCDLIQKDSPINLYVLVSAILQKHPLHAKRRWESYLSICFRLKVKMNKGLTAFKILLFDGLMFVLWFLFPLSLSLSLSLFGQVHVLGFWGMNSGVVSLLGEWTLLKLFLNGSPFYSICFLLPMLCQITMKIEGCKALASSGGHKAVSLCIILIDVFLSWKER